MPTLREMMSNLSETMRDSLETAMVSGVIRGDPDTIHKRLDICCSCEQFEYEPYRRCKVCGCAMSIKIHFAAAKCPQNKWGPVKQQYPTNSTQTTSS